MNAEIGENAEELQVWTLWAGVLGTNTVEPKSSSAPWFCWTTQYLTCGKRGIAAEFDFLFRPSVGEDSSAAMQRGKWGVAGLETGHPLPVKRREKSRCKEKTLFSLEMWGLRTGILCYAWHASEHFYVCYIIWFSYPNMVSGTLLTSVYLDDHVCYR